MAWAIREWWLRRFGAMRVRLIAVLVAAVAALVSAAPAVSAAVPVRLVYASDWSGVPQLYVADPSGSAPTRQLISPCGFDFVDGDRIAVYGPRAVLLLDRDGRQLLSPPVTALGVRLDGTDLAVLTRGVSTSTTPSPAPNSAHGRCPTSPPARLPAAPTS